jgi:hypothetical protein
MLAPRPLAPLPAVIFVRARAYPGGVGRLVLGPDWATGQGRAKTHRQLELSGRVRVEAADHGDQLAGLIGRGGEPHGSRLKSELGGDSTPREDPGLVQPAIARQEVTELDASRREENVQPRDELAVTRAERDLWLVRLRQAELERDGLRANLAEALAHVEYWRTLAEYREKRLVERQDLPDRKRGAPRAALGPPLPPSNPGSDQEPAACAVGDTGREAPPN